MHFKHIALLACTVGTLAACQDSPTSAPRSDPAGGPRLVSAEDLARLGVTPPAAERKRLRPRALFTPCYVDEPCEGGGGLPPRPMADYDYGASAQPWYGSVGGAWYVHAEAWSAAYAHIASMTLDVTLLAARGCPAVLNPFPTQHLSATGSPKSLQYGGHITDTPGINFAGGVQATHYFQASIGYSTDGAYARSESFPTSARACVVW